MASTLYRLSEECLKLIEGADSSAASSISINDMKLAVCQVANSLLKTEFFQVNARMGETIPNGTSLGLYENIAVQSYNGKSTSTLPVKPIKLPRNMGVFAIYPKYTAIGDYELDKEFIPLQMGQAGLLKSQPMINNLLGQVGYEVFGNQVIYTKDIKGMYPDVVVSMRLAILDMSQYDDWDILPILPEQEWQIKQEVFALYMKQPIPDRLVDVTSKDQKGVPIKQQQEN